MSEDRTRQATGLDRHFVALHSGFRLGKYELQAVLGQGGFGITYQAWDSALNRAVAIKEYLPSDVAVRLDGATVAARSPQDEESFHWGLERFLDEARALARFDAIPAIVRVHDYMQENGTAYMVMALVEGEPLAALYRREAPLSEERLKAIVLPILDGLEEVHRAGFLHRDIKPANILIRPNGSAVLIDFGAARQALGEKSRSITSVFTPGYAPFEQYTSSGKQGPWTDIYALAATLYHGISGAVPPQATDRIREDGLEPARRIGAGRYSEQFLAAIDRGMEVFENRRPQSIGHWRDMLSGRAAALPDTEVPTLGENGQPYSQPAYGQPAHSQTGAKLTGASQPSMAPPSTAQPSMASPSVAQPAMASPATMQQAPRRVRTGLLVAAALGVVALGGGAAAVLLGGGGSAPTVPIAPPVEETAQQRAERLAQEARIAAEAARTAQLAAEQEAQRRAEEEARQRAIEEERRREQAALAEAARREEERARQESDGERQRAAAEEARRLEAEEEQRRREAEQAAAARAQAAAELAEARAQAEAARQQAEALRQEAERQRLAAEEERRQQAAAEAKAREEAAEKARAEIEARLRAEFEARAQAEAEARAKAEAEAKARAEAEAAAKAKAEAEARAQAEAEAKARAQAEAKAKAEAEAKARAEAEARAKADAERQRLAAQQIAQQQAARQTAQQQAAQQPPRQPAPTTSAAPPAPQQAAVQPAPAPPPAPVDPAAYVAQHWAMLGPVVERAASSVMFSNNFRVEIIEGHEVLEVTPARIVLRLRVYGTPLNATLVKETRRVILAFENAPPAFRSLGQVRAPGS